MPPAEPFPPDAPTFVLEDPGPDPVGDVVALGEEEGGHVRSLRLRAGDRVRVTDGSGRIWGGTLEGGGREATCRILEELEAPPPLPVELAFGVANKKRTLWMVEKAVELGVLRLQPVEFHRSRSVADAGRSTAFWRKAGRRAVSALKQCGGARIPEIGPVRDLHDVLGRPARPTPSGVRVSGGPNVLLDRDADRALAGVIDGWSGDPPLRVLLGPEGGLTAEERDRCLEAGYAPATLGPRVLRFETAAVAALAVAAQRTPGRDGVDPKEGEDA